MTQIIDIFHATVAEQDVERLLAVRDEAIAGLRERCGGPRRAELVRVEGTTWMDLVVWDDEAAAEEAARHFSAVPALGEMHAIIGTPTSRSRGSVEHAA